jgi:hypothetical protein
VQTQLSSVPRYQRRARVVAEVVDSDNCELLSAERRLDFVVSPEIVSMLLTQLSQQLAGWVVTQGLPTATASREKCGQRARTALTPTVSRIVGPSEALLLLPQLSNGVLVEPLGQFVDWETI